MTIDQYIEPLFMNGLRGRMLRMPSQNSNSKIEFLVIYGHHSSLERMSGFYEFISRYGNVTAPDLPGFGGMESFYKIGEKPTIENYADYLAAFVKLRFKRKRFVLIGMSFSVPIYIRMLQKYPEIAKKVDYCISLVGFVHHEDFVISKKVFFTLKTLSKFGSMSVPATIFSKLILRETPVRLLYSVVATKHGKLVDADPSERKKRIKLETKLWVLNDFRTRMYTITEMSKVDLCSNGQKLDLKICHMNPKKDFYFDADVVNQHMQIIFSNFKSTTTDFHAHAPSVTASADTFERFTPKEILKILKDGK